MSASKSTTDSHKAANIRAIPIYLISLVVYAIFVAMSATAAPPGNDWQSLYADACKEFEVGHNDQAELLFQKALNLAKAFGPADVRYLRTANYLADVAFMNGELDKAGQLYVMVLDNAKDLVLLKHSAASLRDVANATSTTDKHKAVKVWTRVFQVPTSAIDPDQWVDAFFRLTQCPLEKDLLDKAIAKVRLAISKGVLNQFEARRLCQVGKLLDKQLFPEQALKCANMILDSPYRKNNPDDVLVCEALNLSSRCYIKQQKWKEAEHAVEQSLAIIRRHPGHERAEMQCIQLQLEVYGAEKQQDKQVAALQNLAQVAQKLHAPHAEFNAWNLLAKLYGYRGEAKKAEECKKKAAEALTHPQATHQKRDDATPLSPDDF